MQAKSERITILGTPDFKKFLLAEAHKEGVSLSQLVRQRCEQKSQNNEEDALLSLIEEVSASNERAQKSLAKGVAEAETVLAQLRGAKNECH